MRQTILFTILCSTLALADTEGTPGSRDFVWILALGLTLVHLGTPLIKPTLDRFNLQISSFGGGAAISYVFIHLLPELGEDNEYVGGHIYGVVLIGFLIFYYLKTLHDEDDRKGGILALVQACLYSWLLIYGISSKHADNLPLVLLATVALSFHILHEDHGLSHEYPWLFQTQSRLLLASMPLLGLASRRFFGLRQEGLSSLVTAVLAGMIIYNSFEDGLPSGGSKSAFRWFLSGSVLYGLLAAFLVHVQS